MTDLNGTPVLTKNGVETLLRNRGGLVRSTNGAGNPGEVTLQISRKGSGPRRDPKST